VLSEAGSEVADEVWDAADSVLTSQIAYPELRAALAAAQRSRRISSHQLRRCVADAARLFEEMRIVGIDARLAAEAGELAERVALRGYDAVHLAAALAIDGDNVVFATWDRDLAAGVAASGLPVVGV